MSGAAAGWMEDAFKDMREDLWNERAYYERGRDREHAVEDAKLAYQRNVDAYKSRYVWTMNDMANAGLNPILAASQGVGGVPGAPVAQQTGASFPRNSGSDGKSSGMAGYAQAASAQQSLAQAELTTSQARVNNAQAEHIQQQTRTEQERPEEIRASVERQRQAVQESIQTVKTLGATEVREYASAAELVAREEKIRAELPQIKATIDLLVSQKGEIDQRVKAQLPELLAALHRLEASAKVYGLPGKEKEAMVQSSPVMGTISAMIKALSPLIR